MSIDVKVTRNDMTGPYIAPWMITVTVQNGEHAAMQYCKMSDAYPKAEDVGNIVRLLYGKIVGEEEQ